jgi:hypothetical protein
VGVKLFLKFRGEHRLKVLEKRVLRRIFGLKRDKVTRGDGSCVTRSFITCIILQL